MSSRVKTVYALFLLMISAIAQAETNDRYQPMTIDADKVTVDELKKTSVFTGHVVMNQGTMQVKADKVVYRQNDEGDYFITANGKPINFRQKQDNSPDYAEAFAEQLEFDSKAEQAHLIRNAVLRRGKDEVRGDSIFYDMRTQQYEVKGRGKKANDGGEGSGRVRLVIQPRKAAPADAKNPPAEAKP